MNAPGRAIHAIVCQATGARGPGGSCMPPIVRATLALLPSTFTASHRGGSGPPLVCLHGFTDTWRTWELVLPVLERHHEVLAPALLGHAGGPPLNGPMSDTSIVAAVERAMDEAGFETAHVAGNSLGGYVALQLAERGRARSVVAFAPAGGWAAGDDSFKGVLAFFANTQQALKQIAPHADAVAATLDGRRQATQFITTNYEHIPAELVSHLIMGAASCPGVGPMIEHAHRHGWPIEPERITCPVRIVWGTSDRVLTWPSAAAKYRAQLPQADWIELDGVGHCPQLDVPLETAQLILGFS
jgi:pimeloyl-ACP methyl ester carboxylesterase